MAADTETHRRWRWPGGVSFPAALLVTWVVAGAWSGCVPYVPDDGVTGPTPPGELAVVATASSTEVFEGFSASVSAVASGGAGPYQFRWDQNGGPEEVDRTDPTAETVTVGPFPAPGRYVFRVVATDADGLHASDYAPIEVLPAVSTDVPELAVIGESAALSATVEPGAGAVSFRWEVQEGTATVDNPTSANAQLTTSVEETVIVALFVQVPGGSENERTFEIVSVADLTPQVLVGTSLGDFTIELNAEAARLHTINFLLYVDDGFYDGLLFHRVVCEDNVDTGECEPFVVQSGGYHRVDGELEEVEATRDPVESEADNGLSNGTLYSVALALRGEDVNSGTTQFYINMQDNSFLDDLGFTVFGMVVSGTDVVDTIAAVEVGSNPVIPGEVSLPVEDVIIERINRSSIGG